MSEPNFEVEQVLGELSLVVEALEEQLERFGQPDGSADTETRGAALADIERLAEALSSLADTSMLPDIASLGKALGRASAHVGEGDDPPVPLLGAHDAIAFLRWRVAGLRAGRQAASLDAPARAQAATITAALTVAAGDGVASVAGSVAGVEADDDDDLSDLAPDEQELVRSFPSLELSARPGALDGAALAPHAKQTSALDMYSGDEQSGVRWFVAETESALQALGALIAAYRHGPDALEQLTAMARIAHMIKGSAPAVGLFEFKRVAIYLEMTLSAFRDGRPIPQELMEGALGRFLGLCETCLVAADSAETPPPDVVGQARQLYRAVAQTAGLQPEEPDEGSLPLTSATAHTSSVAPVSEADITWRVGADRLDALIIHLSALAMNRGSLARAHGQVTEALHDMGATVDRLQRTSARIGDAYPVWRPLAPGASTPGGPSPDPGVEASARVTESSAARLQRLAARDMDAQRQEDVEIALRTLPEIVADVATHSAALASALMSLGHSVEAQESVIRNLQQDATRMRLAPLADFAPSLKVHAGVVARECKKHVRFTLSGEMTEIDRKALRTLIEPLRQLVLNAIVHGIETPAERVAAGKDETGSVWVRAYYASSDVVVEVGDDGAGVNSQALLARAVRHGHLSEGEARALTPEDVWRLVFKPGMTTLDHAGAMAGSGIGLAEVARVIRGLKGEIDVVESSPRGAVFRIRAPMTLTVLQTIEIHAGAQTFAAPWSAVSATLNSVGHLATNGANARVDDHAEGSARPTQYLLPGSAVSIAQRRVSARTGLPLSEVPAIPAYSLAECLGVASEHAPEAALIVERHGRHLALLVDKFGAMTETMVRPLPPFLRRALIRGVTIRAEDGAIALLVDVAALADRLLEGTARAPGVAPARAARVPGGARVLIVDDSVTIRRTLDQTLSRAGFATALARDGFEALTMMEAEVPRVVILDVEMQRLDGFELLEIMRGSERYARTRVVMLTSRAGSSHEQRARDLGADDYLIKPSSDATLIAVVRRLLSDSEMS